VDDVVERSAIRHAVQHADRKLPAPRQPFRCWLDSDAESAFLRWPFSIERSASPINDGNCWARGIRSMGTGRRTPCWSLRSTRGLPRLIVEFMCYASAPRFSWLPKIVTRFFALRNLLANIRRHRRRTGNCADRELLCNSSPFTFSGEGGGRVE